MIKKATLILLFTLAFGELTAKDNTPMDAFIARVKQTISFPRVTIWNPDNNFDRTEMLQKVEKAQPLTIDYARVADLMDQKLNALSLVVPGIDGGMYTIDLAQYDFLTNDFQVHTLGADGAEAIVGYTPGLYYRGVVNGIPGSVAAFSFFKNEVYGIFSIPGEGNYVLVPNTQAGSYYDNNVHYILYNDQDLKIKEQGPGCATDRLPGANDGAAKSTTTLNNDVYNNCTYVRVFEVADYATYLSKGSSVTNVTNYMTALFNNQSTLYRNEGVPIVLQYLQVNTATDAYQSITVANSIYFLDKFGWVTQNTLHGCDLAILFSTKYGTMGGVAWIKAMCKSYASDSSGSYGFCNIDNAAVVSFPTFSWDVEVSVHEMGHMVGSPHTHHCCWNPPGTGTTAIDGCYTIEGTCGNPGVPSPTVGGTIMSYCHLTSSGINFSNGFGPQPGDTIRYYIAHRVSTSCGVHYYPSTVLTTANRTLSANRECTDLTNGNTYYWNDHNTADQSDDTLVLMINKNGNNIGNLDVSGFAVSTSTLAGYGSGTGYTVGFPAGTSGILGHSVAMRRFWTINATTAPASAVEVMFPFSTADTSDVDGSVPGAVPLANYKMYKINSPIDPSPADGFPGAAAANFSMYTYGTTASTTNWSLTTAGTTNLAHMKMTNLSGGGTGFYTYGTSTAVANVSTTGGKVQIYPNPTHDRWMVAVAGVAEQTLQLQVYTVDGKVALSQELQSDHVNSVDAGQLLVGVYFYRIVGNNNLFTGNIIKN